MQAVEAAAEDTGQEAEGADITEAEAVEHCILPEVGAALQFLTEHLLFNMLPAGLAETMLQVLTEAAEEPTPQVSVDLVQAGVTLARAEVEITAEMAVLTVLIITVAMVAQDLQEELVAAAVLVTAAEAAADMAAEGVPDAPQILMGDLEVATAAQALASAQATEALQAAQALEAQQQRMVAVAEK